MKKLSQRQKNLAVGEYPTYAVYWYSTLPHVKKAKILARGKFWNRKEYNEFVAFTPDGKRAYYGYDVEYEDRVRKCARLWSKGKCKEANELYCSYFNGACFKIK